MGNGARGPQSQYTSKEQPCRQTTEAAGRGSRACRANSQGSKGSALSSEAHMCTAMLVLVCVCVCVTLLYV